MIVATLWLGWRVGDYAQQAVDLRQLDRKIAETEPGADLASHPEFAPRLTEISRARDRFRTHFFFGVGTALIAIFINCISVTYLIGTSRWVKEVTEAYGLDRNLTIKSTQLKRQTFPWSLAGIVSVLTIVALGAASDPATGRAATAEWAGPHGAAAVIGGGVIVWSFLVQGLNLQRNAEIIAEVTEAVRQERERRGLQVDPAPAA
jgi:hypothetical protein